MSDVEISRLVEEAFNAGRKVQHSRIHELLTEMERETRAGEERETRWVLHDVRLRLEHDETYSEEVIKGS